MSSTNFNSASSSQPQQGPLSAASGRYLFSQVAIVVTAGFLLMAGWLLFILFAVGPTFGFSTTRKATPLSPDQVQKANDKPKTTSAVANATPSAPKATPHNTVDLREAYARQEQLTLLRLQRTEFESRTANLKTAIDLLEERLQKWDRRLQGLAQSEEGKRLASSAREFRFLKSLVPLSKTELGELRELLSQVRVKCTQANAPLADLTPYDSHLDSIQSSVRTFMATFDSLEATLVELLASSKPSSEEQTLAEAIAKLDSADAELVNHEAAAKKMMMETRFQQEIEAAQDRLDKLRDKLAKAQSDLKRCEADSAKQLAEAQNKRDEQLRELTEQRLAAKKRLEEQLPQFRSRLSPFITPGYRQLKSRWGYKVVIDAQPVSYSALLGTGALDDDVEGLEMFLLSAGRYAASGSNDRPVGSFPKPDAWVIDTKNPQNIQDIKAVQEFLRRHGEAMVEAKLLAP